MVVILPTANMGTAVWGLVEQLTVDAALELLIIQYDMFIIFKVLENKVCFIWRCEHLKQRQLAKHQLSVKIMSN